MTEIKDTILTKLKPMKKYIPLMFTVAFVAFVCGLFIAEIGTLPDKDYCSRGVYTAPEMIRACIYTIAFFSLAVYSGYKMRD